MNQNLNLELYVRKTIMSDLHDRSDLIRDFLNFVVPGLVGIFLSVLVHGSLIRPFVGKDRPAVVRRSLIHKIDLSNF